MRSQLYPRTDKNWTLLERRAVAPWLAEGPLGPALVGLTGNPPGRVPGKLFHRCLTGGPLHKTTLRGCQATLGAAGGCWPALSESWMLEKPCELKEPVDPAQTHQNQEKVLPLQSSILY